MNKNFFSIIALLLLAGIVVVACQREVDFSQPPDIRFGEDICDECNMIISEPRFAAAHFTFEGASRRFDDIGDMLTYHAKHNEDVAQFWVHDYKSENWLMAENAFFVVSEDLHTPMGHGVVAFEVEDQAQSFASEVNGMVMIFSKVMDNFQQGETSHQHMEP